MRTVRLQLYPLNTGQGLAGGWERTGVDGSLRTEETMNAKRSRGRASEAGLESRGNRFGKDASYMKSLGGLN